MVSERVETSNTSISDTNVILDTNQRETPLPMDEIRSSCVIKSFYRPV